MYVSFEKGATLMLSPMSFKTVTVKHPKQNIINKLARVKTCTSTLAQANGQPKEGLRFPKNTAKTAESNQELETKC